MIPNIFASSNFSVLGNTYTINQGLAFNNLLITEFDLEMLVMCLSYICGLVMIVRGFALYKAFGQNVNQATRPGEVAGPLVYIVIGAMLFYFPAIFNVGMVTIFGTVKPSDLVYTGTSTTANWSQIYILINRYCRFIGIVSFFRGLILISRAGEQGSQPGSITRGVIHLVAGIMIYNIGGTVAAFEYTFGITKVTST
jgi:UPF0716 family protein affecting phage T7 exclusion